MKRSVLAAAATLVALLQPGMARPPSNVPPAASCGAWRFGVGFTQPLKTHPELVLQRASTVPA